MPCFGDSEGREVIALFSLLRHRTNAWTHVAITMYTTDADFDTAFGEEEIVPSCRGCRVSDECGFLY